MRDMIINAIEMVGVLALTIGVCGMDSEQLIYPIIVMVIGGAIVAVIERIKGREMN